MAYEIMPPGTGADVSEPFTVAPNDTVTVSFIGGPGASDSIALQYCPDGVNWYAIKENGVERLLDINNFVQLIRGPIRARVNKLGTTGSPVGVALHTKANP